MNVSIDITEEMIETIARRAAEIVVEQGAGNSPELTGYIDVAAAAEFLCCPVSRIYALKSAGRIPYHQDGSRLIFDRKELRAYVAAGGAKRP